MATTPPPDEQPTTRQPAGSYTVNMSDIARLPIPGNAELLIWVLALIVAWLVCWIADSLTANDWLTFFMFTTVAYLISRLIDGQAEAAVLVGQHDRAHRRRTADGPGRCGHVAAVVGPPECRCGLLDADRGAGHVGHLVQHRCQGGAHGS